MEEKYYITFEDSTCCYISKEKPTWIPNLQTYQTDSLAYIEMNLFKLLFPEIHGLIADREKIVLQIVIKDGKVEIINEM